MKSENVTNSNTFENNSNEEDVNSPIKIKGNSFTVTKSTVRFIGRNHVDTNKAAYGFYNVASGVAFSFKGSSLEMKLTSSAFQEHNLNYIAIYIDDAEPISICVEKDDWYKVVDGLDKDKKHNVKILKRSMSNAGAVYISEVKLSDGGELYRYPSTAKHKIQVLGDSITCGYGTLWDGIETEDVTKWQAGDNSYATMLAKNLDADLEVVAVSGEGVGNVENKPYPLLDNYKQQDNFNNVECDFSLYVPEVVVIALGTNDIGQQNPPDTFKANAKRMVRFIREKYPDAYIVWTYGVMGGASYCGVVNEMVNEMNASGEKKLWYLQLDPASQDEMPLGQHGHPGMKTHIRMAEKLTDYICNITGWTRVK